MEGPRRIAASLHRRTAAVIRGRDATRADAARAGETPREQPPCEHVLLAPAQEHAVGKQRREQLDCHRRPSDPHRHASVREKLTQPCAAPQTRVWRRGFPACYASCGAAMGGFTEGDSDDLDRARDRSVLGMQYVVRARRPAQHPYIRRWSSGSVDIPRWAPPLEVQAAKHGRNRDRASESALQPSGTVGGELSRPRGGVR